MFNIISNFYFHQNEKKLETETETKNEKINNILEIENNLLVNKIGLYNAGGSCYMASIIQILIHLKKFLDIFLKYKKHNKNTLSYLFYDFINEIAYSKNPILIKDFASKCNKFLPNYNGRNGNNPMTFFTEFINKLSNENNQNILNLFVGKKSISFKEEKDSNYEEEFIFYLANLNENLPSLYDYIYNENKFGDESISEEIIGKPEIFIINLEIEDNIGYKFEEELWVDEVKYNLIAINRYTDFHSTA